MSFVSNSVGLALVVVFVFALVVVVNSNSKVDTEYAMGGDYYYNDDYDSEHQGQDYNYQDDFSVVGPTPVNQLQCVQKRDFVSVTCDAHQILVNCGIESVWPGIGGHVYSAKQNTCTVPNNNLAVAKCCTPPPVEVTVSFQACDAVYAEQGAGVTMVLSNSQKQIHSPVYNIVPPKITRNEQVTRKLLLKNILPMDVTQLTLMNPSEDALCMHNEVTLFVRTAFSVGSITFQATATDGSTPSKFWFESSCKFWDPCFVNKVVMKAVSAKSSAGRP